MALVLISYFWNSRIGTNSGILDVTVMGTNMFIVIVNVSTRL